MLKKTTELEIKNELQPTKQETFEEQETLFINKAWAK